MKLVQTQMEMMKIQAEKGGLLKENAGLIFEKLQVQQQSLSEQLKAKEEKK
jgi:hypothetical protein